VTKIKDYFYLMGQIKVFKIFQEIALIIQNRTENRHR